MRGTKNKNAFKAYLEGEKLFTIVDERQMEECRDKFTLACQLDPTFARAWGYRAYAIARSVLAQWLDDHELDAAERMAKSAVDLDPDDYAPLWDLAFVYLTQGKFDESIREYKKALYLYDNWTDLLDRKPGLLAEMAEAYVYAGEPRKAIPLLERAMRIPDWYRWNCSWAHFHLEEHDEALEELAKMRSHRGSSRYIMDIELNVAAYNALKGNSTDARAAWRRFNNFKGGKYSIGKVKKRGRFKHDRDENRWLDALRASGAPEN